jgi:hypothetical protein
MIRMTYKNALELATQAVEEKGEDYVYTDERGVRADNLDAIAGCANWHYSNPDDSSSEKVVGCLVGNIMHRAGLNIFKYARGADASTLIRTAYTEVTVTDKAHTFLRELQSQQDSGRTWGEALEIAKKRVSFLGAASDQL